MSDHAPPAPRWPKAQRFELSPRGRTIAAAYRADVAASRGPSVHRPFEHARATWAERFGLALDDGLYLIEIDDQPCTLRQLDESLAICGQSRGVILDSVRRLLRVGLLRLVPLA